MCVCMFAEVMSETLSSSPCAWRLFGDVYLWVIEGMLRKGFYE